MGVADGAGHPAGDAWGGDISPERQAELEVLFARQAEWATKPEAERGESVFKDVPLTGGDVFWLAARSLTKPGDAQTIADQLAQLRRASDDLDIELSLHLSALHLEEADLSQADLTRAHLTDARLAGVQLYKATLAGAHLVRVNLAGADLEEATLTGANLDTANLTGAKLTEATLAGARLQGATLSGAKLWGASLVGADLAMADLPGADLFEANLSGADVDGATLAGADLRRARLDVATDLNGADLAMALVADVIWNGAALARVGWERLPQVGDERQARQRRDRDGKGELKAAAARREEYEAAVRSYRLLAVTLRSQGLNEHADRYAYRAQLMQRVVQRRQHHYLRYAGSWLLGLLAGYGYRPLRTLFWYVAVIGAFAFAYFQATHGALTFGLPRSQVQPLVWYEALVLSVSSFHGRGFFQPVQSLGDPVAILAAIEAVFGLFIEVSFIATFTQRYFGK